MTHPTGWKTLAIAAAVTLFLTSCGFSSHGDAGDDAAESSPVPTRTAIVAASPQPTSTPTAAPTATPRPPEVTITHETCCAQAARYLDLPWSSDVAVRSARLALTPAAALSCSATVAADGRQGRLGCDGLLAGATDYVATLTLETAAGSYETEHRFRTMGDRLEEVPWFTEFEDPLGPPLACAAASVRMIQLFTTGEDKMTAYEILEFGVPFNRSNDPGLDPAAIATALKLMDPRNDYHYYVFATKEGATEAAVYWLLRSGKPVVAITLAGQHAPLVTGFSGSYGSRPDDPTNEITGVIVQDPQRGDLRPETNRRPDLYRAETFKTGHLLEMDEWYGHEWWLGFPYWYASREGVAMDRSDGAYPTPHWSGKYVIVVADGDSEQPSDLMGRVAQP